MRKTRSIRKILIANRGEIAIRIIRTCKELGISTVAVFSEADRNAPFVRLSDEGYCIGLPPASESYLNQSKIISIANEAGVDAIHPGYGFLSENSTFAKNVIDSGIIFIGPTPNAMKLMGDKTSARELARSIGIPVVPGTPGPIQSVKDADEIIAAISFPVLLKAAGGGGGKGMRVVHHRSELPSAFEAAKSEARSAFGDDRVYVERYIEDPKHIEVQVIADRHGNVVHLGERECSVQRRHQKIIEESPSIAIDDILRTRMTASAIELTKASSYENAGTIEFILDTEGNYYFLEMNTRLQVEHPVTEMRTGIDLVKAQIRISEGDVLPFSQHEITFRGHAIECRIYAEDSMNNFFPSIGTISYISSPGGFGVREERGVELGSSISTYYDPMISKMIVWGMNRTEAIERMVSLLQQYELFGVKNNIDICLWSLLHPQFRDGTFTTNFIRDHFTVDSLPPPPEDLNHAAILASLAYHCHHNSITVDRTEHSNSKWKSRSFDYFH